jgi:Glucose / Sorbosone dehydrogenase
MSRITRALLAAALLALLAPAAAAATPTFVSVGSFDAPIYAASPPRDTHRLFVVERAGRVWVVKDGRKLASPFLNISDQVATDGERGLLSIAFPPDYESSGLFYVYLAAADPLGELQVREYHRSANPDVAAPTGRIVWSTPHDQASNHNGGTLDFGPDGKLWFATGDGGGSNNQFGHARDLGSQLGKLLRIDPQPGNGGGYTIPADNPFGTAVWAFGLRNPFRFSFDTRGTRDLFIGDVGQGAREELDWAPASEGTARGADFGWSCREGTIAGPTACDPTASYIPPIWEYGRDGDNPRAVTGGYLVRDPGLPTLVGRYTYADTYSGVVRSFVPGKPLASGDRPANLPQRDLLVSFAEDACGHLYVVSLNGSVERVQDGVPGVCVLRPEPAPLPPPPPAPVPVPPVKPPGIPDRTSPRVRIQLARHGKVGLRATPRIALTATETCRVTITAKLAKVKFKRVRAELRGGRRTIVRLRPGHAGVKRIHAALRRHRRLTLIVSVRATDAAGNTGRVQRRMKVRRG